MKSPREVLMSLFGHGWAVDECLDPTPEETYIDESLTDLSEIVMGLKHSHAEEYDPELADYKFLLCEKCDVLLGSNGKQYKDDCPYNQAITDIAKLFTDKEQTKKGER